ncbi:MAG: TonB family protein [Candidatus Omnitrophota bacterium]|nr:TonB family protein [Candidatus Omnitrophota bacterium]
MKRKLYNSVLFFLVLSVFCSFSFANSYALDEADGELKLYLGENKTVPANNLIRIAIGNPNIADVIQAAKYEITIAPKAVGTTMLMICDNFGEQTYRIKVFSEDLTEVKRRIDNLFASLDLKEVFTKVEEEEAKVFLLGRVKTVQDRERIFAALGALKDKTIDLIEVKEEEAVVEIDVQVLELSKDAAKTLGFTWPGSITITEAGSPALSTSAVTQVGTSSATTGGVSLGTKWSTLFKVLGFTRGAFSWTLDALVQEGKARILSRPRLACQSGKEAELLVGGEKPIFTTSTSSTAGSSTSVEYKEYGIKLKVKPIITREDQVKLSLKIEVSEVGAVETIGSPNAPTAKAYPLLKRSASTELFLNDEQTMAIGGLIKQKSEEDIRKIAGLGNLPIIGALFRKRTTTSGGGQGERGDMELFITLTPSIISKLKPAHIPKMQGLISSETKPEAEDETVSDPKIRYAQIVQERILDNLEYPITGRQAGFQGTVKLALRISYDGTLLETKIKKSSGYELLDNNALRTAEGITAYPPFPAAVKEKELWIDIPIDYRL